MKEKKYRGIQEVSDLLDIKTHVIRYWDSRIDGISTRMSKNTQRFFSADNIKKLEQLKKNIYQNGKHVYSLDLVNKLVENKKFNSPKDINTDNDLKNRRLKIEILKEVSASLKRLLD